MHSLERMEMAYPQDLVGDPYIFIIFIKDNLKFLIVTTKKVGKSILKLFYGSFEKIGGLEKDFWFNKILQGRFVETVKEMDINSQFGEYNKIDLNDFYKKTRPKYILKIQDTNMIQNLNSKYYINIDFFLDFILGQSCILNQIDCRNYWQFRRSLLVSRIFQLLKPKFYRFFILLKLESLKKQ